MFRTRKRRLNELEELAYGFAPKLYRLACARLASKQDAEDLVQDAYCRAFAALGSFQPGSNMEAWLTTILLNTIRDHIRKVAKTGPVASLDDLTNETEAVPAALISSRTPESILEETELGGDLAAALQELPEPFLLPLILRDIQDLSYKEIAACLDIPVGTVMSRLARGREALRKRLLARSDKDQQQSPSTQRSDHELR